jgi:hypothetical protein
LTGISHWKPFAGRPLTWTQNEFCVLLGASTVPSIRYWPGCVTVNESAARCGLVGPLVLALPLGSET